MISKYGGLTAASLVAVSLILSPGVTVAAEPSQRERAEAFARQGMERLMQALDLLIGSIPQYELPFVDDNGDIIIRRRHDVEPEKSTPDQGAPEIESTDT